jgi:chemotaxis protein MotA
MNKHSDLSTLLGIVISLGLVILSILLSSGNSTAYIDLNSVLIVLGGTAFVTIACFSGKEFVDAIKIASKTLLYSREDFGTAAKTCIRTAEIAKKDGILGLQNYKQVFGDNQFFSKGVNFIIDGIAEQQVEKIIENETYTILKANKQTVDILRKAAEVAPAMGLIGTLIGLVQMLGSMEEPSKIGPAMAIAILTTLYGAVLSYMILLPLSTKVEKNSSEELVLLRLYSESIISISRQESPRRLEMQLNAILQPKDRVVYFN